MQRVGSVLKHVGLILVLAGVMGCAAQGYQVTLIPLTALASQSGDSENSEYIVEAGDTLTIKFYYHPDHDQRDLVVRQDGKLFLPLVGDIQAAGLTPERLAEQIAQRYAFTLREPKVAVEVKTPNTSQVYVGGEVQRPGVIKLRPGMNVLQAIFEAGGPKDTGDVKHVVLLRSIGNDQVGYRELNLMGLLDTKNVADDAMLAQDDLIFIPKTGIAKVNLWVTQYVRNMMPFGSPIRPIPVGF